MARGIVLLLLLLAVLALAGCGNGTPARLTADQETARVALIEDHPDFVDRDLARLCPGLYPRDFLTSRDKYAEARRGKDDPPARITAQDRVDARAAGCDVFP